MAPLPPSMRAIKLTSPRHAALSHTPVPTPTPSWPILCRVSHIAINPADANHIDHVPFANCTVGCDFSGSIAALDLSAPRTLSIGDRIASCSWGVKFNDCATGAFGEYALCKPGTCLKVPPGMPMASAATLGTGFCTVALALCKALGMGMSARGPTGLDGCRGQWVLVYGGSTSTGLFAVQVARLCGLRVIAACGEANFDKVRGAGAEEVVAYRDAAACVAQVRRAVGDEGLRFALDCISSAASARLCAEALAGGGRSVYSYLQPGTEFPGGPEVEQVLTVAFSAYGEEFGDDYDFDVIWSQALCDEDRAYATQFWAWAQGLVDQGLIRTYEQVRDGGLDRVLEGVDEVRNKAVSGAKLVYQVADA